MRARALGMGWWASVALAATSACSGGGADGNGPGVGSRSVANFNRPPGMLIGRGASAGEEDAIEPSLGSGAGTGNENPEDIEIPSFEEPPLPDPPPCSGCIEISAVINDINQGNDFSFSAGGVAGVTRVVWTILVPFNSDQLFIRSVVNGSDGAYTFLSANIFPALDTPVELAQQFTGTVNTVGLRIGSAGAWTGNERVSIFVDSVAFEGAAAATTRTFDGGAEGMASQGTVREPLVTFHP